MRARVCVSGTMIRRSKFFTLPENPEKNFIYTYRKLIIILLYSLHNI